MEENKIQYIDCTPTPEAIEMIKKRCELIKARKDEDRLRIIELQSQLDSNRKLLEEYLFKIREKSEYLFRIRLIVDELVSLQGFSEQEGNQVYHEYGPRY